MTLTADERKTTTVADLHAAEAAAQPFVAPKHRRNACDSRCDEITHRALLLRTTETAEPSGKAGAALAPMALRPRAESRGGAEPSARTDEIRAVAEPRPPRPTPVARDSQVLHRASRGFAHSEKLGDNSRRASRREARVEVRDTKIADVARPRSSLEPSRRLARSSGAGRVLATRRSRVSSLRRLT